MNESENAIINSDNDIINNPIHSSPFRWYHHIPRNKYKIILECVGSCFQSKQSIAFSNNIHILPEEHIDCSICLTNIIDGGAHRLMCGHIFHPDCIHKWVVYHKTCPMCRATI
jgi:hypothetical protein